MTIIILLIIVFQPGCRYQKEPPLDQIPQDIRDSNPFKRSEWFHSQRAFPFDTLAIHTYYKERTKVIANAIDPNNPEIIYAGTGEVTSEAPPYIYDGRGLFKSTDGGNSWRQITNGFGEITRFSSICVSPHDSKIILAGLSGGYRYAKDIDNIGVWRSANAGETWERTLSFDNKSENGAFDVIVHPTKPNIVYAAIGGDKDTAGFYISTDNGVTWDKSNSGLPEYIDRMQITIANSLPSIIYAVIYKWSRYDTFQTKVFKSIDTGKNWARISEKYNFGGVGFHDQGWYDLCIAVDLSNENHVFVGNIPISMTINGKNFNIVPNGCRSMILQLCPTTVH